MGEATKNPVDQLQGGVSIIVIAGALLSKNALPSLSRLFSQPPGTSIVTILLELLGSAALLGNALLVGALAKDSFAEHKFPDASAASSTRTLCQLPVGVDLRDVGVLRTLDANLQSV